MFLSSLLTSSPKLASLAIFKGTPKSSSLFVSAICQGHGDASFIKRLSTSKYALKQFGCQWIEAGFRQSGQGDAGLAWRT
jgi:hypothetical protein